MKVYVHLATGFEEVEALTVVDVLRRAEIDVESVSVTGELLVEGAHGIKVQADLLFDEGDYDNLGMIVLPGGIPGTPNLANHKGLMKKVNDFAEAGRPLAAICAAPMILGEAGHLKDRKATIYPGMEEHLLGAIAGDGPVEIDGNFITSRGPGTAFEFALSLVEFIKGKEVAETVRKALLLK